MNWGWLGALLLTAACATPEMRTPRALLATAGLGISNSPMFVHPQQPRVSGGRVAVTYSFLIDNFGERTPVVQLGAASLTIASRHPQMACKVAGHALAELLMQPGTRYRVDCEFAFSLREVPLSTLGDVAAQLTVPITLDGRPGRMHFEYLFLREDAS